MPLLLSFNLAINLSSYSCCFKKITIYSKTREEICLIHCIYLSILDISRIKQGDKSLPMFRTRKSIMNRYMMVKTKIEEIK